MTDTILNVSRELLADLLGNDHDKRIMAERHLLAMLANAPSPAGVDGCKCSMSISMLGDGCRHCQPQEYIDRIGEMLDEDRLELSDAQAIIDGLRGKVAELESTLADNLELSGKRAVRIAEIGHELADAISERDRQAQRIGELEGLLLDSAELIKHGVFEDGICCCGASVDSHGFGDGHSPVDALAYHAGQVCERIDAALSAGKDSDQ